MARHDASNIIACFCFNVYLKYNHSKYFYIKGTVLIQTKVKSKFLFLLISLLLLFFFYPFFQKIPIGVRVLDIVFLVILLSGMYALSKNRNIFIICVILALAGFGATVLNYTLKTVYLQYMAVLTYGAFFTLLAAVILSYIIREKRVTSDTIYGSICGYLLLGIVWTMLFSIVEVIEPGSFLSGGKPLIDYQGDTVNRQIFSSFIYYSFVTLTTLGYGDITPVSPPARALSSLEAVTGQLYIAVLIARLVGMHIVHATEKK
jgi:hypothetical protein